jgi:hypothetical protein
LKGLLPLIKDWFGKIWDGKDVINFKFLKKLVVKGRLLYAKGVYGVVREIEILITSFL